MTVRRGLINLMEAFASMPEELLDRELTIREGATVYPVTEFFLIDSEVKYHTALLWGRVELELKKDKPICRMSPLKGWVKEERT